MKNFMIALVLGCGLTFVKVAGGAWLLMLAVGGLHSIEPWVKPYGFWTCFLACLIASALLHMGPSEPFSRKES